MNLTPPGTPPETWDIPTYNQALELSLTAADAYYNSDQLLIDDDTYDQLIRAIGEYETAHNLPPSQVRTAVAAGVGNGGTVTHPTPMLSLGNAFTESDLRNWGKTVTDINPAAQFTVEPKLDGLAISALYIEGNLDRVATRGDGLTGEDVTYAAATIVGLPQHLTTAATLEVRGEVVLTHAQYEEANQIRVANNAAAFTNPRSGAAGALRGAQGRTYDIPLTFFAYSAHPLTPDTLILGHDLAWMNQSELLRLVEDLGVSSTASTPPSFAHLSSIDEVLAWINNLATQRAGLGVDIDGAVVKVDDGKTRHQLGQTARAPRGAIAWKFPAATTVSTLEEVTWQVGRTGVITPRARIAPVDVGGATITYASLHNPEDIERKGFLLHDQVTVLRAGDVVPRLEAPLVGARTPGKQTPIHVPQTCPQCGASIDKSEARWRCVRGRNCGLVASLVYAGSRDAWDIDGLGEQTAQELVNANLVQTVADIFTLTESDLLQLPGYSTQRAQNLLTQINQARSQPFARTVTALGIRGTGRAVSRRLADHFPNFAALYAATGDDFQNVEGIGVEKSALLLTELEALKDVTSKLISLNIGTQDDVEKTPTTTPSLEQVFAGERVVVTGSMTGPVAELSRGQVQELAEKLGAVVSSSVSKRTTLVVAGAKAGNKLQKANQLGILTLSPEEFHARLPAGWENQL